LVIGLIYLSGTSCYDAGMLMLLRGLAFMYFSLNEEG